MIRNKRKTLEKHEENKARKASSNQQDYNRHFWRLSWWTLRSTALSKTLEDPVPCQRAHGKPLLSGPSYRSSLEVHRATQKTGLLLLFSEKKTHLKKDKEVNVLGVFCDEVGEVRGSPGRATTGRDNVRAVVTPSNQSQRRPDSVEGRV